MRNYTAGYIMAPGDVVTIPCNCIGPQSGDPVCPCMMTGYRQREMEKRKAAFWDEYGAGARKPRFRVPAGRRVI
jgi:hypothetical protein